MTQLLYPQESAPLPILQKAKNRMYLNKIKKTLQQAMPKLTAGTAFYKQKLWVDSLGVYHCGEGMEYTCVCDVTPILQKAFCITSLFACRAHDMLLQRPVMSPALSI